MTTSDETHDVPVGLDPVLPVVDPGRRRRRPSGAPPPLPRHIGFSGKVWLVTSIVLLIGVIATINSSELRHASDRVDSAALRQIAKLRTGWLTNVMTTIDRIGSGWWFTVAAVGTIVALIAFRRWRHLFTFLGSVVVLEFIGLSIYQASARSRPYDVTIIGRWAGFSMPSPPVAVLTILVVGIAYTLVVPGRPRTVAKWVAAVVITVFATARLYLGVDHPTDVLVAIVVAVALSVNAFRTFTPNEVFPVTYRRGKTAHLDVSGRRLDALRKAVSDQLGLTVLDVKPVGLESSGGSTPLRLEVAGDPNFYLFGKLYAMSHVRADRWYKWGRTILYGRMEDETPFQSVSRLVEYEDYALRMLRDIGVPSAAPYGIVEMTPGREYLLVTEFFDGASELGDADVDDGVIDEGLLLIRQLWDAGLAHRDIKPANLLVRDGRMLLIDVFFVQIRPSPWRQAVDLANMMLVLAVRTDANRVCQRALQFFTPDDIAEAFAAARGVASPTQLRTVMKQDGRDLLAEFRALAPARRPISLQRWSFRRFALAAGLVAFVLFAVTQTTGMFTPAHNLPVSGSPDCGTENLMILSAQAVPSATTMPCLASLPAGWHLGGVRIKRHQAMFWLDSDLAGDRALEVRLVRRQECDISEATEVPSDEVGVRRYERPEHLPPALRSTRFYLLPGGCVTYRFAFDSGASPALLFDADSAVSFQSREALVDQVERDTHLSLCGAGAPCPD